MKRRARKILAPQIKSPFRKKEELDGLLREVLAKLRPKGLKSLRAVPSSKGLKASYAKPREKDSGGYEIVAVASPGSVVGVAALSTEIKKDVIRAAMNSVGTIEFLKKMADKGVVSVEVDGAKYDVDMAFFSRAWSDKGVQRAVSKKFRQATDGNHEWLPAKYILDVAKRARDYTDGAKWVEVQHKLRSETAHLVFFPSKSARETKVNGKKYSVPQGHVGAVYFTGIIGSETCVNKPMTLKGGPTGPFHNELGTAFTSSGSVESAVRNLRGVMTKWIWDGVSSFPHPIHSSCVDKDGTPVTSRQQTVNHAAVVANFDNWDK